MKTTFGHLYIYVSDPNQSFRFYKQLLTYFEFKVLYEDKNMLGISDHQTEIWLERTPENHKEFAFHRKRTGINHFALKVRSKEDVDTFTKDYLQPKGIKLMYETPRLFPEYTDKYYAVFFEDPDRIKLEVFYA